MSCFQLPESRQCRQRHNEHGLVEGGDDTALAALGPAVAELVDWTFMLREALGQRSDDA